MIYADNAATTKLDPEALEAMKPFLLEEYGNASQPYAFARAPKKALRSAREEIAGLIGAKPEEIFFTSGGTESDNWAIKETVDPRDEQNEILTSMIEHHAILHSAQAYERSGGVIRLLPVNEKGVLLPETLRDSISDRTKLVSVMLSNNEVGTIEPIAELAKIAHEHGALFHTDAVQSIGHIPVNVQELGIDMLSASAHKFHGPRGIGFLYIKGGTKLHSFHDGGGQESGLRAGTEDVASIVGMAVALRKSCAEMNAVNERLLGMEKQLLESLSSAGLDYIRNGDQNHVPGNISLSFRGASGEMLLHRLDFMKICISTGSACNSVQTEASHVLTAMHVPEDYINGTIRVSLGNYNTEEEVEGIADALIKILGTGHM